MPAAVKAKLMSSVEAAFTAALAITVGGSFASVLMFSANASRSTDGVTSGGIILKEALGGRFEFYLAKW